MIYKIFNGAIKIIILLSSVIIYSHSSEAQHGNEFIVSKFDVGYF